MVKDLGVKVPLELRLLDDESDPTKTVQRLETHATEGVMAYLGGFGSDLHAAAAAIADKNKTPYLGVAFALQQVHDRGLKYLFSPFPKSPSLAVSSFDIMDSLSPKPTKVAIFVEKTDWGAEMKALWKTEAQKRGYQIVADEEYAPGSKDFAPMILNAKSAGAEAVLALPNPPDGMAIVKQMKELDFTPTVRLHRARGRHAGLEPEPDEGRRLRPAGARLEPGPEVPRRRAAQAAPPGEVQQERRGGHRCGLRRRPGARQLGSSGPASSTATRSATAVAAADMMTVMGPVTFNPDGTGKVVPSRTSGRMASRCWSGRRTRRWRRWRTPRSRTASADQPVDQFSVVSYQGCPTAAPER